MTRLPDAVCCPDCGADLPPDPEVRGLCPQCLLSLALEDSSQASSDEDPSDPKEAETLDRRFTAGRILGDRYQIRELLGRGGMGEVFRAFDLKLRVDVALKAVRSERMGSDRGRELLRQEVRSAREVVSPNVCRIFDLVSEEGQELVSMEYIDGTTLGQTLRERGPLSLAESREIASQFLSGLEAIHQSGLVHRDFKAENVMLTRAGRVVVMDFGLAKARTEGRTGTISGTPAYMAPEQARGDAVDARADIFSAGVVLAEMLVVGRDTLLEERQALWRGVRDRPPKVPEGPWAPVLKQALSQDPEERYASARALARALEEVTQRLPGFETKRPYPGLSSFTEEDAEYFFGREAEVEALWKKLKRPRLLALVAPSGAGKTSFVRAGLLPTLPKTWKALITTPGPRPFQALARTLVPVFSGDTPAMEALLRFEDADTAISLLQRFRRRHEHALVVIDQFEELFTLNPPEVQQAFAELLGRLVLDADLYVILSLRDDFLLRCQVHEPLVPAFSDLTPLGALSDSSLRRALVQPALSCGYRFEDDSLVDEMVAEVQKERGALPLIAFAASRLWEKRDHEKGLLTRAAYREIGGVAGALAQHAEATLERVGTPRVPLVREIFRNLVTAQGTRAVREREELLSIFAEEATTRAEAEQVLNALVDARLLTSYDRAGDAGEAHQQVEIIHESLLQAWPRLVRWQTQDADGARLRDQLRQAAQLWQDRGKTEDLLWSGTAYRDFALWRERYAGGLTAVEEAFARAAARRAGRKRRRTRVAVATLLATAAAVALTTSALWRRAEAEVRRAEASRLVTLGDHELASFPTGALAYAVKSLEVADSEVGRLLALRALQRGPLATLTPLRPPGEVGIRSFTATFSPNGEWLALGGFTKVQVLNREGRTPLLLGDYALGGGVWIGVGFGPEGDILVADRAGDVRVWSFPDGHELRRGVFERGPAGLVVGGQGFLALTKVGAKGVIRWWPFIEGASPMIGSMDQIGPYSLDSRRRVLAYAVGRRVYLRSLADWTSPPRIVADHPADVIDMTLSPDGRRLAASDPSGVRIWPVEGLTRSPRVLAGRPAWRLRFDPAGKRFAGIVQDEGGQTTARLWDLTVPTGAEPRRLPMAGQFASTYDAAFEPSGRWLVTAHGGYAAFWPLGDSSPLVFAGQGPVMAVAFTPDGKWLVSASSGGLVGARPLAAESAEESRVLLRRALPFPGLAVDSASRNIAVYDGQGHVLIVPLAGGAARELGGLPPNVSGCVAFSSDGRLVAAAPYAGPLEQRIVRVWDLEAGTSRMLPTVPGAFAGTQLGFDSLRFVGRNQLLASVIRKGLMLFDLETDTGRMLAGPSGPFALSHDERLGLGISVNPEAGPGEPHELTRFSLDGAPPAVLRSHGSRVGSVAMDSTATLVATGSVDGTVRIGSVSGETPHLFLGHDSRVRTVAFSPDGRWVASGGDDGTIRLWPVPDVSKPPTQSLPLEALLSKLRTFTNLRAVPDRSSATGYKLEAGPFPGWANAPAW